MGLIPITIRSKFRTLQICNRTSNQNSAINLINKMNSSHTTCNILNFDLTLMGISPIDYDVTLMFNWYIGSKTPLHMNMIIV